MKLFACLFAGAAAAAAAAANGNGNGDSPNATLHEGSEECITAANIVRAARLNTPLGLVERSPALEKEANQTLASKFNDDYSCKKMEEDYKERDLLKVPFPPLHAYMHDVYACIGTPFVSAAAALQTAAAAAAAAVAAAESRLFLLCMHAGHQAQGDLLGYVFEGNDAKCLEGMVKVVNKLLTDSPEYPPAYNETVPPWNTEETQIAARVLWQTTKSAGCAYTTGCQVNWMVCKMSDQPKEGEYPFTKEVYEALLARRAAGVDVASLTAADIGKPLNSSSGGPWGFVALQCLLLGLLTAGGALVLAL
ncbi:hypothetical protein Efla_000646 [Eimeria flavescens]